MPRATNNHTRGQALEDLLQWQHNIYESRGEALIWHQGTQGKIRGGKAILVQSQPDFAGVLTCLQGRYVSFDAKLIATPRYHHPRERLHQLSTLWNVQEAGGISFLLISIELERFFLIWPDVSWRDERGLNVNLDRLRGDQGCEFERNGGYGLPDWLQLIRAIYEGKGLTSSTPLPGEAR